MNYSNTPGPENPLKAGPNSMLGVCGGFAYIGQIENTVTGLVFVSGQVRISVSCFQLIVDLGDVAKALQVCKLIEPLPKSGYWTEAELQIFRKANIRAAEVIKSITGSGDQFSTPFFDEKKEDDKT